MIAIDIPEEVYTMKAKRSIIKNNALLYRKASKKQKKEILDDLVKALHLHRKYITTLLNHTGKVYYTPQGIKLIGDPTITLCIGRDIIAQREIMIHSILQFSSYSSENLNLF